MAEKYSITIQFDTANAMADWLQHHTYPTNSNVNVNLNTGEVNGGASANANDSQSDPWADAGFEASTTNPTATSSGPIKVTIQTRDKGPQDWTFNSTNAPTCGCGNPAAFCEGTTNGKPWKAWRCAKRRPDEDTWKNACDFNEFVGGRGKK
jgi:hypothetical protein